ncbi:MAG: hypothetical protein LBP40_02745, partial [Campylobacteraceae bacterium]|nr:hypothetical protein [Campylobacteraceae bacterium]
NSILDKITYLYYLYIPIIFIIFAVIYSSIAYTKNEMILAVDKAAPAINAQAVEFLDDIDFPKNLSISNIKDAVQLYISELITNAFSKYDLPQQLKTWLIEKTSSALADKILIAKVGEFTSLDIGKVKDLWSGNLRELISNGFITDMIRKNIEEKISGIQNNFIIIFLILLLIPFVETAVSKQIEKRKNIDALRE